MAGVARRRRHDPRGRRRAHRPRPPRGRAGPPRRPAAQARQLLRRVERDRDRLGRRGDRERAPPPRRARLLRLRRRRPYLPIDMAGKDAVFLSPHKFAGGPGTPGVLVAKRALLQRRVPSVPGGGTVVFVSPTERSYHPDPEVREEAGTPAIVESIRAGLVFALKEAVGAEEIHRRERAFARRALASWAENPNLRILGNPALERLAIVSLGIRHPRGMLHSNFVVALLSDLFGIQARSGCFCAGPYIHRMYPVDPEWSAAMHAQAVLGRAGREARLHPPQLQLLHQRGRLRVPRRGGPPARERGLEAAAALPLRRGHRALAPRERRPTAAADPRRPVGRRAAPDRARERPRAAARAGAPDHRRDRLARAEPGPARPLPLVPAARRGRGQRLSADAHHGSDVSELRFRRAQPAGAVDRHHAQ